MLANLVQASGGPRRGLYEPGNRFSAPRRTKPETLRNEISAYRSIARPHRCPFASKRLCGSYAAPSNVSATTAAALRTDGAAPLSIPCCAAARSAMLPRAAPRAGRPRAAHHEPSAREPESVAASVQFSRRPRETSLDAIAQRRTSHRWRTRRIDGVRGPHESHTRRRTKQQREWQRRKHEEGKRATKADNMKAQRQARKDLLKRKRDLAKRKKERDRRKRSVSSAYGEL